MDYSKARICKLVSHLKKVGERAGFEFEGAGTEDIKGVMAWVNGRDIAEATKADYRIILKRFYKWLNGGEYPNCVDWISTTLKKSNSKLPKNMLTEDDIDELLEASKNGRDRALIAVLWETGARIGELIDLTVRDLEDHHHGMKVVIDGKTGPRRLLLISSVPHLQSWFRSHPRGVKRTPLCG